MDDKIHYVKANVQRYFDYGRRLTEHDRSLLRHDCGA